ncbi:MAG: hypothetical protein KAQ88_07675 [Hyphomicrobiaceae bacterium]|nr:hypothetical protein [Hyphomicrobiaceae bacterium]
MGMQAEVVNDWSPNIDEIRMVLPVTSRNIFAYDNKIFNPSGVKLGLELHAHEMVHFKQQAAIGVEAWWTSFLVMWISDWPKRSRRTRPNIAPFANTIAIAMLRAECFGNWAQGWRRRCTAVSSRSMKP